MGHIAHISRFCGVTKPLESAIAGLGAATLRRSLPTRAEQTLATGREAVAPPELPKAGHIISQKPFMPFQPFRNGVAAQVFDAVYGRVSSGVASILRGLHLLLWRGKHFKGALPPGSATPCRLLPTEQVEVVPPPRLLGDAQEAAEVRHLPAPQVPPSSPL
ncbi:filamin ABP280 repeat-containing protein, putative [Babesia caballi]|uniref:Filamin ABP280 repeat-containing protein, putative n=1 Tax=Babesia caballi TaxID=5871 RepID=A0AAV4LRP8_BABCB|nr:filamin ABP280 repeat-containing protein, putative [Babesia caballi]